MTTLFMIRSPVDKQLVSDIQKAINGEFSAIACYKSLAEMAPAKDERSQITEIRKDEIRHLEEFKRIYISLTGKQPTPQRLPGCPSTYKEGLDFSFHDEQKTVDFCLDLAERMDGPSFKQTIRRAAPDEQNHAVWFMYFIHKNQRKRHSERQQQPKLTALKGH
ncbi:ferritin-like domain-containing protein [Aeromicrobium ponti]|nr:ferritin-like domain-containing protein [Cytobacillus oceanisediminis]